jgi:hypothetical protein
MSVDIIDLVTPAGIHVRTPPSSILVFTDETGDDSLRDPIHPIYGIGGCVAEAQWYRPVIAERWRQMKNRHFQSEAFPLHAADLRVPTADQLSSLNDFFTDARFGRFATVFSNRTLVDGDINLAEVSVVCTLSRIKDILSGKSFSRIVFVLEESPRADQFLSTMEGYKLTQGNHPVRVDKYVMKKIGNEPGLEVADFVIHCAGTSVRARLAGKRSKDNERKDFEAVFKPSDGKLSSFFEVTGIEDTTPGRQRKTFDFGGHATDSGSA